MENPDFCFFFFFNSKLWQARRHLSWQPRVRRRCALPASPERVWGAGVVPAGLADVPLPNSPPLPLRVPFPGHKAPSVSQTPKLFFLVPLFLQRALRLSAWVGGSELWNPACLSVRLCELDAARRALCSCGTFLALTECSPSLIVCTFCR